MLIKNCKKKIKILTAKFQKNYQDHAVNLNFSKIMVTFMYIGLIYKEIESKTASSIKTKQTLKAFFHDEDQVLALTGYLILDRLIYSI